MPTPVIEKVYCNNHDDLRLAILKALTCGTGLGKEQIVGISDTDADGLPGIPPNATSALVVVESDGTETDPTVAVRFSIGDDPTAAIGIPLADKGNYRICGAANLPLFKIIAVDGGTAHNLQILYFD